MKRVIALFALLFCFSGPVAPQTGRTQKTKGRIPAKASEKTPSTVGLGFYSVVKDHRDGVWITGTAFLLAGLMVNDRNGVVRPVVVSDVNMIREPIFVTAEIGWMNGRQYLYRTTNGGLSWRKRKIPGLSSSIGTVHFLDSQNGWVGGSEGEIFRTTDGGQSWKKTDAPLKYEIRQIAFVDPSRGWAVGSIAISIQKTMQALFRTSDGGDTWQVLSNGDADTKGSVESVCFVDQQTGWGVEGWQHNLISTRDGGKTWAIQDLRPKGKWNSVFFIDALNGWAIGQGIAHTSDGGASWDYQVGPETYRDYFEGITFVDSKRGWVVASDKILRTEDGGRTWRPLPETWKRMLPDFYSLLEPVN